MYLAVGTAADEPVVDAVGTLVRAPVRESIKKIEAVPKRPQLRSSAELGPAHCIGEIRPPSTAPPARNSPGRARDRLGAEPPRGEQAALAIAARAHFLFRHDVHVARMPDVHGRRVPSASLSFFGAFSGHGATPMNTAAPSSDHAGRRNATSRRAAPSVVSAPGSYSCFSSAAPPTPRQASSA